MPTPEATAAAFEALAQAVLDAQEQRDRYFRMKGENAKAFADERKRRQEMQARATDALQDLKQAVECIYDVEDSVGLLDQVKKTLQGIVNDEEATT